MERIYKEKQTHRLTEPAISYEISDALITGVITTAVMTEKPRPALWQDMLSALEHGVAGTKEGTVNSSFFQAMVDRLLDEFHNHK